MAPDAGFEPATKRLTAAYSTAELIRNKMVRMRGLEPPRREAPDPKSGVSANFTTSAKKRNGILAKHRLILT